MAQLKYTKPDIEGAKKLLAEAGYPERLRDDDHLLAAVPGVRRHLAGLPGGLEEDRRGRQGRADRVGRLHQALGQVRRLRLRHRRTAFTFRPDPDGYVYSYYKTGGDNNTGYSNPKMDDLLEQARTTPDNAKRKDLYTQVQLIVEEDVPYMFWYVKNNIEARDRQGGRLQAVVHPAADLPEGHDGRVMGAGC